MPRRKRVSATLEERQAVARQIVADAKRQHGDYDDEENGVILDSRRGRAVRIEVPIVSITAYRQCLLDIVRECHRQMEDSRPTRMKGRHTGIVLGGYQATWRKYVSAWKRRG
jgi:hypothetical protein